MTREDVERLLHCARTEGLGAGPNTLADVCEWALATDDDRMVFDKDLSRVEAELRQRPWIEGDLILQGEHEADVGQVGVVFQRFQEMETRAREAEAKLAKAREALREAVAEFEAEADEYEERHEERPRASWVLRAHAALSNEEPVCSRCLELESNIREVVAKVERARDEALEEAALLWEYDPGIGAAAIRALKLKKETP